MPRHTALVLTTRMPWPLDDGGRIALWQNLSAVARSHDVTLISFVPVGEESSAVPAAVLSTASEGARAARPPSLLTAACGIVGRWPYRSRATRTRVRTRRREETPGTPNSRS